MGFLRGRCNTTRASEDGLVMSRVARPFLPLLCAKKSSKLKSDQSPTCNAFESVLDSWDSNSSLIVGVRVCPLALKVKAAGLFGKAAVGGAETSEGPFDADPFASST